MERRTIASRKLKIAEIREREAHVRRAEAESFVRNKEEEIAALKKRQRDDEEALFEPSKSLDGAWFQALDDARRSTKAAIEIAVTVLEECREVLSQRRAEHLACIGDMQLAQNVLEKVTDEWRLEEKRKEARELDEIAAIFHKSEG